MNFLTKNTGSFICEVAQRITNTGHQYMTMLCTRYKAATTRCSKFVAHQVFLKFTVPYPFCMVHVDSDGYEYTYNADRTAREYHTPELLMLSNSATRCKFLRLFIINFSTVYIT